MQNKAKRREVQRYWKLAIKQMQSQDKKNLQT